MLKKAVIFNVVLVLLWGCVSCSTSKPKDVSFKGKWKQVFENCIMGVKEENVVDVFTDGEKFRMESENSIQVYDGKYLYSKIKNTLDESSFPVNTNEISPDKVKSYKFWFIIHQGKTGPGGNIAGQETVLYQVKMNRPDGEIASQVWVDAKTGIVLKSIQTVYSHQVSQMVTQQSQECLEISYGYVDDGFFIKPE
ncbi:hypothetical protein KAU39_03965 [bacterium]|nr:hypothetical protein [bacterium]